MHGSTRSVWLARLSMVTLVAAGAAVVAAFTMAPTPNSLDQDQSREEMVLRGRELVINHGCGGCHGGGANPAAEGWLVGITSPSEAFPIGECGEPGAEGCFMTRPRNLTPDNTTGMGRFSDRQIFNALRYGLRPGETADVEITSSTPGEGNFPMFPKYLAPPMPWNSWRHMSDDDLWAIAAYLKDGLKPVSNQVADSEGPPDFWASGYVPEVYGTHPAPDFPAAMERMPGDGVDIDQVLWGRQLVLEHACGDCHGGLQNPDGEGFLAGAMAPEQAFPVGPCFEDPEAPCFFMRPRNLTPHEEFGTGRYSERQIFNAVRYGLRPGTSPDVEITDANFPENPDFLGPGMPWYEFRHMPDDEIRAIAAYLKHGLRPVANDVPESDVAPGGWAGEYTVEKVGPYPAAAFPTANEKGGD